MSACNNIRGGKWVMDRGVKLEAAATLTHASFSHSCLLSSSLHCSCLQQRFWLTHLWWLLVFFGKTWLFCSQSRIMGKDYFLFMFLATAETRVQHRLLPRIASFATLIAFLTHFHISHRPERCLCVFLCQGSFGKLIIGCANIAWGAAASFAVEFLHVLKY